MAKSRLACSLCSRMKGRTVQECQLPKSEGGCGNHRYCAEHISWSDDLRLWVCDKCLRRRFGFKRGPALIRAVGETA